MATIFGPIASRAAPSHSATPYKDPVEAFGHSLSKGSFAAYAWYTSALF